MSAGGQVSVPGDWPNVSWAMYAPIGATEESLAKERALANGFMHEEKERARTVVAGGQEDGGEAPYFTAHPTTEPSDCSDEVPSFVLFLLSLRPVTLAQQPQSQCQGTRARPWPRADS